MNVDLKYPHLKASMNQLSVANNRHQRFDKYPRVLFVCSAGVLRSATAAAVFAAEPYNWNTRTAGADVTFALNPVTEQLLEWADKIVIMTAENYQVLEELYGSVLEEFKRKIVVWEIPDHFEYRSPQLVALLKDAYTKEISQGEGARATESNL